LRQLNFAAAAARDLRGIIDYIALDNPSAAENVFRRIAECADRLREFPEMGRPGRLSHTRELSVGSLPYVIVYEVDAEAVTVLAVFHTARDLVQALADRRRESRSRRSR